MVTTMMPTKTPTVTPTVPSAHAPSAFCTSTLRIDNKQAQALQALLDRITARNAGHGGAVLSIRDPVCGPLWEGVSGMAHDAIPMTPRSTFEAASIMKTFTATVVLQLAEEGRIALDAPVADHLPAELRTLLAPRHAAAIAQISWRQLLGHRSGLPDYWTDPPWVAPHTNAFLRDFLAAPTRFWQPTEILGYVGQQDAVGAPGELYHYSDSNYVLLGLLIEHVTGKPLHQSVRERILSPLGLHDTYLSYRERPTRDALESYRYEDDEALHGQRRQSADWSGGGIISSVADLSRFIFALADGELIHSPGLVAAMRTFCPTGVSDVSYGLGLFCVTDAAGELWGHDGHGNSFMYYWPAQHVAFVGTLNQTDNDWWPLVSEAIELLGGASDPTQLHDPG